MGFGCLGLLTVAVEELQLVVSPVVGLFSRLLLGKERTHARARTHTHTNMEHAVKHIWETDKFSRVSLNPGAHPPFGAASRSKCPVGPAPRGTRRRSAYPGIFAECEPSCWISTAKTLRSHVIVLSSARARLHVHASVWKVGFGELKEVGAKRSSTRP